METFVSEIFEKRPGKWGLRGDPYLWDELENYFSNIKIPYPEEEFKKVVCVAFEKFTGRTIYTEEFVYILKYSYGGMSSGMIDPQFWNRNALPLLTKRLKLINDNKIRRSETELYHI